jgi:short-subunit dehydrogenase
MTGIVIVGAGPGIATSVAARFGSEGMPVSLVARSEQTLQAAHATLGNAGVDQVSTHLADASRPEQLIRALDATLAERGTPDVLVYNAVLIRADKPGELDHAGHLDAYAVNVLGALHAAAHVGPRMAATGAGTILLTGGMPRPVPGLVSLSLGKAGLRALTTILAAEYGPSGVHVATVTVGGAVVPGSEFDPDRIAAHYWRLHTQPQAAWETEFLFAGEAPQQAS